MSHLTPRDSAPNSNVPKCSKPRNSKSLQNLSYPERKTTVYLTHVPQPRSLPLSSYVACCLGQFPSTAPGPSDLQPGETTLTACLLSLSSLRPGPKQLPIPSKGPMRESPPPPRSLASTVSEDT